MYKPIQIDRKNLTIMGVSFPDLATFDRTANAIGSNMYEGFEPTVRHIALIRDYVMDKITFLGSPAKVVGLIKPNFYLIL